MHLRAPPQAKAPAEKKSTSQTPFQLDEKEADLRHQAALTVPFPDGVLASKAPRVWAFCVSRGRVLSCHPGGDLLSTSFLGKLQDAQRGGALHGVAGHPGRVLEAGKSAPCLL